MKGYYVSVGYMGWIPESGSYQLFASESDYIEWIMDSESEENA